MLDVRRHWHQQHHLYAGFLQERFMMNGIVLEPGRVNRPDRSVWGGRDDLSRRLHFSENRQRESIPIEIGDLTGGVGR